MLREQLLERFMRYVKIDTTSDPSGKTFPSTPTQIEFGKLLKAECEALGLSDVSIDDYGYVFATLPATSTKELPTIGFLAHMDTAPAFTGKDVKPILHTNYQGGQIVLNATSNMVLDPAQFPVLNNLIGEDLITTDGTTLLGADDKSGIASIMTAMAYLLEHPEIEHGKIRIGFTPDEEIGHGVDHFDVARFGADFAYTIDGGTIGEVQSQSFNAAGAKVTFNGVSVHPGTAKDRLVNSILLAQEFNQMLPQNEVPEKTEGLEGFFMLHDIKGSVDQTVAEYIVRDHDRTQFEIRKALLRDAAQQMNERYKEGTVIVDMADNYYNMREIIDQHPAVMALANEALTNLGLTPNDDPIRGGTDGSRLSFMGLPCPNIFTGGYNFHGRYEFLVISEFEKACQTVIEIARLAATK